jgi:hypothetical protein
MAYLTSLIFAGQFFLSLFKEYQHFAAALWLVVGIFLIGFAGRLLL